MKELMIKREIYLKRTELLNGLEFGCKIYRNVVVILDEDRDGRVFDFVDSLDSWQRDKIKVVQESKGALRVIHSSQSTMFPRGEWDHPGGDSWNILELSTKHPSEQQ